jgi:hypothetical protein
LLEGLDTDEHLEARVGDGAVVQVQGFQLGQSGEVREPSPVIAS